MNNVKSLNKLITEVTEAVNAAYDEGFKAGSKFARVVDNTPKVKSLQEIRDDTIVKAIRDVADVLNDNHYHYTFRYKNYSGQDLLGGTRAKVEFVVNKEKRTVVAIIKPFYGKSGVLSRGIAKCAPEDCFNVHIGKAIALRRALGLEVPAEYLNAPQPTEVRVGDIVSWAILPNDTYTVTKVSGETYDFIRNKCGTEYTEMHYQNISASVIDDSREEVAE